MLEKEIIRNMATIIYSNGYNIDFVNLCKQLDGYFNEVNGIEKQEGYNQYNTLSDITDVWIAYEDKTAIGCAAFKQYENKVAEVKRVFVKSEYRGKGISRELMKALESKALEKRYKSLILETGKNFKAAIGLYQSMGYAIIENFGQYKNMPESICMQKDLA